MRGGRAASVLMATTGRAGEVLIPHTAVTKRIRQEFTEPEETTEQPPSTDTRQRGHSRVRKGSVPGASPGKGQSRGQGAGIPAEPVSHVLGSGSALTLPFPSLAPGELGHPTGTGVSPLALLVCRVPWAGSAARQCHGGGGSCVLGAAGSSRSLGRRSGGCGGSGGWHGLVPGGPFLKGLYKLVLATDVAHAQN